MAEEPQHDEEHTTTVVRKALCGVARVHARFGLAAAVKLLKGAPDARLQRAGLERTPTFGTLADFAEEWLLRLLRRCVTAGWVDFEGGDRPVAVVTTEGREVIHARRPVRLLLPAATRRAPAPTGERERSGGARPAAALRAGREELDAGGQALFEALRAFRLAEARRQQVPPYVIASDRTLRDVALLRPDSLGALELAHGIGPAKVERYGEQILAIVKQTASGP